MPGPDAPGSVSIDFAIYDANTDSSIRLLDRHKHLSAVRPQTGRDSLPYCRGVTLKAGTDQKNDDSHMDDGVRQFDQIGEKKADVCLASPAVNPIVVIANYVFDSLKYDVYRFSRYFVYWNPRVP